ncbi:MAG: hypothetical protein CMD83_18040 [Gammaproteobacteria bacterium]|nr:hypothetical protein [Gammaproteobacteria bacterium]
MAAFTIETMFFCMFFLLYIHVRKDTIRIFYKLSVFCGPAWILIPFVIWVSVFSAVVGINSDMDKFMHQ